MAVASLSPTAVHRVLISIHAISKDLRRLHLAVRRDLPSMEALDRISTSLMDITDELERSLV